MSLTRKLADIRSEYRYEVGSNTFSSYESEARWWLNAIADELEKHIAGDARLRGRVYEVRWLRSQANPDRTLRNESAVSAEEK